MYSLVPHFSTYGTVCLFIAGGAVASQHAPAAARTAASAGNEVLQPWAVLRRTVSTSLLRKVNADRLESAQQLERLERSQRLLPEHALPTQHASCTLEVSAFAPYSPLILPLLAGRSDSEDGFGGRIGHTAFVCMCACGRCTVAEFALILDCKSLSELHGITCVECSLG